MKSLVISEIFPPRVGGSGRFLWELYSRLPPGKFEFLAGATPGDVSFDTEHYSHRIVRWPLSMFTPGIRSLRNARLYWKWVRSIRTMIRDRSYRSLHCARILPEGFTAYLLKKIVGTPYLVFAHGEDLSGAATSRELTWMARRVLSGASGIIANSLNTARLVIEEWNVPSRKVKLVHPGVDLSRYRPQDPEESWRLSQGWSGRTVILTVSRLQARKGQDMMIRALSAIRAKLPEVLYVIAGDGEEAERLRNSAREQGQSEHVQFMGEVSEDDKIRLYQQCDLFVMPNRKVGADFEGFGMVLLEAQACGKPVLAGDSGGTSETMKIPDTGRIADCTTPETLAQAVIALLSNPAELRSMGCRAAAWAEEFDWPRTVEKATASFRELFSEL